jgi:hypothetical protein
VVERQPPVRAARAHDDGAAAACVRGGGITASSARGCCDARLLDDFGSAARDAAWNAFGPRPERLPVAVPSRSPSQPGMPAHAAAARTAAATLVLVAMLMPSGSTLARPAPARRPPGRA